MENNLLILENASSSIATRFLSRNILGIYIGILRILISIPKIKNKIPKKIIGPVYLSKIFNGDTISYFVWDELRNIADCQNENLQELFDFNEECIARLERDPQAFVENISIPQALSYGFMAAHSEDFPFFVSGLINYLKENKITIVEYFSAKGRFCALAIDCAKSLRIEYRKTQIILWLLFAPHYFIIWLSSFKKSRSVNTASAQCEKRAPRKNASDSTTSICFYLSKSRGLRHYTPILEITNSPKDIEVITATRAGLPDGAPGDITFIIESMFDPDYLKTRRLYYAKLINDIWTNAALEQKPPTISYRGVRIAPHHIYNMRDVWCSRAVEACMAAELGKQFFLRKSVSLLFMHDPLEGSKIFAYLAKSFGIPVVVYYPVYNRFESTALLHEKNIKGLADISLTMNEWQRDRMISIHGEKAESVILVGDVLASDLTNTSDLKLVSVYPKMKKRPRILLASRSISSAMSADRKKDLFLGVKHSADAVGATVLVKAHPHEDTSILRQEMKLWSCEDFDICKNEFALLDLLKMVDVLVSIPGSSTSMDSFYVKTPVVLFGSEQEYYKLDKFDGPYAYRKHEVAICAREESELRDGIERVLTDSIFREALIKNAIKFAESHSGPIDGLAPQRIRDIILARAKTSNIHG